jgi:hypothetical protein
LLLVPNDLIVGIIPRVNGHLFNIDIAPSPTVTDGISPGIGSDLEKIRFKGGFSPETPDGKIGFDETALRKLHRFLTVSRKPAKVSIQGLLMHAHEILKGFIIAFPGTVYEFPLEDSLVSHHIAAL